MPQGSDKMFRKNRLMQQLTRHEGLRLKPYFDTEGIMTIGIGRNLESNGISESEAQIMLHNDVIDALISCKQNVLGFPYMNGPRQEVMVNMMFNLGWPRLSKFKRLLSAIRRRDYAEAAVEMMDSKWARQVKGRALELSQVMRNGRYE